MGSSDDPSKTIDGAVGGLVWVRRRNGSWWPGRIMALDEISEGSLVSPRSGTPVKLLGREDASVDWYNLEKSKRVKAFRCGEYDDCIEKAKANAAAGNKKAVKYARREDAILHALEIENDQLGKDCDDDFLLSNNSGGSSAKESPSMSDAGKEDNDMTEEESDPGDLKAESDSRSGPGPGPGPGSGSDSGSAPELSQSGLSFEEPNHVGASKVQSIQGKRRRTPNDSEDDGTEGIKRMRGLEDLGMVVGDSNAGNVLSNGSPSNGSKACYSSMRRKRTQVANVHELLRRKSRRRPLTKVMESTAVVSVPVTCDQLTNSISNGSPLHGLSDSKVSGIESNESRKSFSVAVNNNSDSTGVSCENGVSLNHSEQVCDASDVNCKIEKDDDVVGVSGFAENDSSDRLFDVPFFRDGKDSAGLSPVEVSPSTRHQASALRRQSSQSSQAEPASLRNDVQNECGSTSSAATQINNISQRMEKDTSKWQLKGKRNLRHKSKNRKGEKRKYMVLDDTCNAYLPGIDHLDNGLFQSSDQKVDSDGAARPLTSFSCNLPVKSEHFNDHVDGGVPEWGKSFSNRVASLDVSLPPQRTISEAKLYDVELDVKASYQPQHVPLVSLMSKSNGKAIIGHPITVELLADGDSDLIVGNGSAFEAHVLVYPQPLQNSEGRRRASNLTTTTKRKSKSSKRRSGGLLSKKIRKLSSLTSRKEECRKPVVEKVKGSVIACIPVKVVFSRINEAVNGSANRALTSKNS
ncbi:Tudor/PWWP/MBT superfamily protein [Euphorbia peplus]|nr:Tudor/PWWP/MBT superfamily protein [Euphorbia peplus]